MIEVDPASSSDAISLDPPSAEIAITPTPPPPPRPKRPTPAPVQVSPASPATIEEPVRQRHPTPPPPPKPHRVGIDPTLRSVRKLATPRPTTSLFHKNVVSESGTALVVPPAPNRSAAKVDATWEGEGAALRREIAALKDREPARAALLLGASAAIALGAQNDRSQARALLEEALGLSVERFNLHLLRREAYAERNFTRALELARRELERVKEPRERLALLIQIGVLEESTSNDRVAARKAFEAAREIDPRHAAPLLALSELYLDDQLWEPLASTYHALADTSSDPVVRGLYRHAAGAIEEWGLKKVATARDTYRAALSDDPSSLPAVVALSSLAVRMEDWGELARALETEADLLDDPAAQRHLYERAGDLHWERLSDADAATTAYRKAALAAPDASGPLRRLSAVLESIGRWNELVDVLNAELPLCRSPDERAELHHLIGEVKENHLERPDEALAAYEAALAEVPDHVASLQALAGLFARTRRLDSLMRAELGEAERIGDPQRRAARYLHLADLALHVIQDEAEAARLYERCIELDRGHRSASQGLESLHRRRGNFTALATLYERVAETTKSASLRRYYLVAAAHAALEADRRDQSTALAPSFLARVEQQLRAAQAIDAPDLTPLYTLCDALEDAGQWEALIKALAALGEKLDDPADQIGLQHRTARILELRLGADARALATYEQILARDPGHEAALLAVVRLHQRAGRGVEEIAALGRLRDRASSASEGAALSYRIGRIHERRLGDTEAAILAYEEALARKPDFGPAPRALERLLRRDRRWPRLIEILERQLSSARASADRAELRYAIGQIEELHQRDLERAEEAYTQALKEVPGHEQAAAALAQVQEARNDFVALARGLEDRRARVHHPTTVFTLLCRLGALAEGPLDDPARAAQIYAQAISASPLADRLSAAALRAARRQGGAAGSTAELRGFATRVPEPRLQAGARLLVALREELQTGESGARGFEAVDPGSARDPIVLDGQLRGLLSSVGTPDDARLASLLRERASTVDNATLRAMLLLETACRFDRAGDARESATALQAANDAVADLLPVVRGVRRIAAESEQWSAAAALYAHEAELARDPENQAEALLRAGELALGKTGDVRQALDHFRRLLALQPLHPIAFERAVDILERGKDWMGIAALHRHRAEAIPDPHGRAEAWRRKAEVERDRLRDVPSALASLRAALEADADDLEAHKAIAPLQEHQRFWQDAIDTYRRIADLSHGDALSRAARIREADLRERELGDREGARAILAELVLDPNDRDAHRRLALLCERMGRWDEAQATWTQLVATRDPHERADALVSLGNVIERGTRDHDLAMQRFEEALNLALMHPQVSQRVEARFREARSLSTFVLAAENVLARAKSPGPTSGQLELRMALARVYLEDLRRPDQAERHLGACAELVPDDAAAFRRLGELLIESGRPERALPLLHRALELEPSSPKTLRAIGAGLGYTGLKDAPRVFDGAAGFIEGATPPTAVPPLTVRRPLSPEEWPLYFPREVGTAQDALSQLARAIESFMPGLVVELTGEQPRGELLEPGRADSAARATFQALGIAPLRIFVDPDLGDEVILCADEALALNVGEALLQPHRQGRFVFELARVCAWIAQGETLGAVLRGRELAHLVEALCEDGGDEKVREVRRRANKAVPRRLRKDLERYAVALADAVGTATIWESSGYAAGEELALILCCDAGVALEALGYRPGEVIPSRGRGVEILRFVASEDCWRAYRRLVDG